MFKRILIPTDFSEPSRIAIGKAIALARLCRAHVEVIHVVPDIEEAFRAALQSRAERNKWEAEVETKLDLALPDEAYPGTKKSLLRGASIPREILQHAVKENFDLIICGSHGRGLLARTLLGSVAQELARNSSIPVLIIPPKDEAFFSGGIDRILVPMDFSLPSLDALDFAIKLAGSFQSTIYLLHAIHFPLVGETMDAYPAMMMALRVDEELKRGAAARLKRLLDGRSVPFQVEMEVVFGDPAHEILQYAKDNRCACIIMGSHGRKGLQRAVLGSVTTSILARTPVPVFTISPRE